MTTEPAAKDKELLDILFGGRILLHVDLALLTRMTMRVKPDDMTGPAQRQRRRWGGPVEAVWTVATSAVSGRPVAR